MLLRKGVISLKKYEILINDVERVTDYAKERKRLKTIKMNSIFSSKKLKELAKKVPVNFDVESIKKFEKETGLNLKYYVWEDDYEFFEYSHHGIYPDNSTLVWAVQEDGRKQIDLNTIGKSLEHADIIIYDRITNYKRKRNEN